MPRNKSFLIGLGTGLIAGAIMLQLMWKVDEMENKTNPANIGFTQDQIKSEAERMNLKVYTQQQVDELKTKAIEEEKVRLSKAAAPTPSGSPAPVPTPAATPTAVATPKDKVIRTVVIPNQADATTVANLLVANQIISEPTKFIALLEEQKLSGKILYGSYPLYENTSDLAEVIKTITTLP